MSKTYRDNKGKIQIECFNGRTYPMRDNKGGTFLWIKTDEITPVYTSDFPQPKPISNTDIPNVPPWVNWK